MPGVGASVRAVVARGFTYVEDTLYVGPGVLLAGAALVLLADGAAMFWRALVGGELPTRVIELLDRILLILMIAEILYTVQVSLREHSLVPEPFLVVALIAGVRRVLIIRNSPICSTEAPRLSATRWSSWGSHADDRRARRVAHAAPPASDAGGGPAHPRRRGVYEGGAADGTIRAILGKVLASLILSPAARARAAPNWRRGR